MKKPHVPLFSHYPLLQLALAFTAGVLLASSLHLKLSVVLILFAVFSLSSLWGLVKAHLALAGVGVLAAIFSAGASLTVVQQRPDPPNGVKRLLIEKRINEASPVTLTGVIDGPPEFARERLYLLIRVERVATRDCDFEASGLVTKGLPTC